MNLIFDFIKDSKGNIFENFIELENKKSLKGKVILKEKNSNNQMIILDNGIYNAFKSVALNSGFASVISEYANGKNRLFLSIIKKDTKKIFNIIDYGKIENPVIEVDSDFIHIAYEQHANNKSEIIYKKFDIISESFSESKIISKGLKSYTPLLIKSNSVIFLIYNSFDENRFKTILSKSDDDFKSSIEIGFNSGNDEYISACKLGDKIAVYVENSMPLFKEDEFIETIIPAFGHGWKVKFRNGLILISNEKTETFGSNISHKIGKFEKNEGATKLLEHKGTLYGVYISFNGRWNLNIGIFNGDSWEKIYNTELYTEDRIKPAAVIKDGKIFVYGIDIDSHEKVIKSFDINNLKSNYVTYKSDTKAFEPKEIIEKRETILINEETYYAYWGDLHMHSNTSLCSRHTDFHSCEVEDKYRNAKNIGSLDFALLTDHDHMSDFYWEKNKMATDIANIDNEFVAFNGYEWTSSMRNDGKNYGHYNVLYKNSGELYRVTDVKTENPEGLQSQFSSDEALTIPHHPADGMHPLDWSRFNSEYATCVEIFQVRGSDEYLGSPMDPRKLGREITEGNFIRDALNTGCRFSFTSGGEHEGVGITCVFAKSLTREDIFEAVKSGRVYGTTHSKIHAMFTINDLFMGEKGTVVGDINLNLKLKGKSLITEVRIVKNGKDIAVFNPNSIETEINFVDIPQNGKYYYYAVVTQDDNEMAFVSPIFIEN